MMYGWGFGWMGLFGLFLIGALIWFLVDMGRMSRRPAGPDAVDILDTRFARGEIDRDEYVERRADLEELR